MPRKYTLKDKWDHYAAKRIALGIDPCQHTANHFYLGKKAGRVEREQELEKQIKSESSKQAKLDAAIKLASTIGQANDVLGRVIERLLLKD